MIYKKLEKLYYKFANFKTVFKKFNATIKKSYERIPKVPFKTKKVTNFEIWLGFAKLTF